MLLVKHTSVKDVFYGDKFTMANSFGLEKIISIDFVAPIV
jgi:hypothetical protein